MTVVSLRDHQRRKNHAQLDSCESDLDELSRALRAHRGYKRNMIEYVQLKRGVQLVRHGQLHERDRAFITRWALRELLRSWIAHSYPIRYAKKIRDRIQLHLGNGNGTL